MNKVITVNLNGNAYQLEESGYVALHEYLANAEVKLKDNPDLSEIMADLEQAIADKCNKQLTPNKNVITNAEIEQILKEMGPVEADADGGEESEHQKKSQERGGGSAPKRLYRIREGGKIAGVCKGLAVYLNVDVTLVRLAFVILAIVSAGVVALGYVAAMIIIPTAETSAETAEAYGLPFNAQELVDQAKKDYEKFKRDWKTSGSGDWREFKRNLRNLRRETHRAMRRAKWSFHASPDVDHVSHVLSVVALPIFGLIIAAFTVIWILAVISLVNTGAVFGFPLPVAVPLWAGILILLALYGVAVGPFKMAFHGRGYYYQGRYYGWPGVLGGLVWMACLILAFAYAYAYIPEVRDFVENLPSIVNNAVRR